MTDSIVSFSKSALMQAVAAGSAHECFSHSTEGEFDVTRMRTWARNPANGVYVVKFELEPMVEFIMETREIDEERVASLSKAEWQKDPGIAVLYKAGRTHEHLMIDGHHRAIRSFREGRKFMQMYVVPESKIIRPPCVPALELKWGQTDLVDGALQKRSA